MLLCTKIKLKKRINEAKATLTYIKTNKQTNEPPNKKKQTNEQKTTYGKKMSDEVKIKHKSCEFFYKIKLCMIFIYYKYENMVITCLFHLL